MRKQVYKKLGYIVLCMSFIVVIWNIAMSFTHSKNVNKLKEIEEGNYSYIGDEYTQEHLKRIFSEGPGNSNYIYEWVYKDINADGEEDLILQEKYVYAETPRIVDVFSIKDQDVVHVLCDYMDADYEYQLCDGGLLYYEQFYGKYDYEQYILYHYDKEWNEIFVDGLELYYLYELEEGQEEYSIGQLDMDKERLYFWEFKIQDEKKEYTKLTEAKWKEKFHDLFGRECRGEMFKYFL